MFNTKIEVDRHVESCMKKINSDLERNLRCFAFAKLYYKVGDYDHAHRYICSYLNAKPQSSEGQNLLGKILERLGKNEAALDAYRSSFDLDPKQNNLIIKVCELLGSDEVTLDQSSARYFCEKAQSIDPYNPIVFKLKEKLVALESKDPNDVSKLLIKELETRPLDVDIRVRLLRHLMQNNNLKEAYTHAYDIEQKHLSIFLNNLSWYETVAEVLVRYQRENSLSNTLSWEFWMLFISVLDKLVILHLDERSITLKSSSDSAAVVFNFDQNLKIASENIKSCPEKQLVFEFLNHYSGQLCLHLATLLYKHAKKDLIKFKEAAQICLPLLFAAYSFQPLDMQSIWIDHTTDSCRQQLQRWHRESTFRCSQVGHILLNMSKDKKPSLIEKATQSVTGLWREQVFKKLFVTRDQQVKIKSSFFALSQQLIEIAIRLPDVKDLVRYDDVAQLVNPDCLHYYVWIGINQKLSLMNCTAFQGLQYSVKNLNNCAAETLNVLDIQSFIYAASICAQLQLEDNRHTIYYNVERPKVLFAAITETLGTTVQAKWLKSAYKMYRNDRDSSFGAVRLILTRGIECIRCIGNHGLDVKLLVRLAKIFDERSNSLTKQSEIEFNEARAELYWKTAIPLLEKLKKNQAISYSSNRIFEYKTKEMNHGEIMKCIDEGRLFLGTQLMKRKDYEKALQMFETLKDPYASFHQAEIYKMMADKLMNQNKENVTSEMRSQNIILLTKSRDFLYLTLDRLRDPNEDRKHPLNDKMGTEIEKIERLLSRIDPDICLNRNECDGMSDENVSSIESDNYNINSVFHTSYTNGHYNSRHEMHHVHSTPFRLDQTRREARPSPERLEAQLRQLAASKDATITHMVEQNKIMVESHRNLVEEFRGAISELITTVTELKSIKHSTEEIREIKKSVDELKASVDELQNFRNVTDVVYEMKKELTELKKDTSKIKSNQLSDEDLYVLDEEYGTDYSNLGTNVALPPSIYPNLPRLPTAANSLAYATSLYHGMYPMYGYPGLGLPQAGALPFGAEAAQLDHFRSPLTQGIPQPGLNQAAYQQPTLPTQPLPQVNMAQGLPPASLSQSFMQSPLAQMHQQTINNFFKDSTSNVLTPPMFTNTLSPATQYPVPATSITNSKAAPVNVVITASDPLPTNKTIAPQILSVTIPPQHLKGNHQKVHNYQIPLPSTAATMATTPSVLNQSPMPVATQSLLSNIAPPVYSAIGDKSTNKKSSLGLTIEKSLTQSFNKSINESELNKSNLSTSSQEEHDPCPDFKPIIPLPDEVPINTGEEHEIILFCERAKLFRFTDKEWKERGVGDLKLLQNPDNNKVRLLMRRDQIHKICANHYLSKDMELMLKTEKAYVWAANDYADGALVLEKLCVQFKTPELAKKFYDQFNSAKMLEGKATHKPKPASTVADLGGFTFTSTPTFKPKDDITPTTPTVKPIETTPKNSPFASFSFTKLETPIISKPNVFSPFTLTTTTKEKPIPIVTKSTEGVKPFTSFTFGNVQSDVIKPSPLVNKNISESVFAPVRKEEVVLESKDVNDSNSEDFEPTAEFVPVIPLPDLVDVQTGEENCNIMFESKAKLLRFDTKNKEWKERGVGQMKILQDNNTNKIRFLMRREQVHKVCCNHQLLKNMVFTPMKSTAVSWSAMDYSEGVFNTEMFAIKFKNEDITKKFLKVLQESQNMLDESNNIKSDECNSEKKIKPVEPVSKLTPLSDKFKSKIGSWECKNCYIVNEPKVNHCVACESPKNENVKAKQPDSQFCFGVPQKTQTSAEFSFGASNTKSGFGDMFKPNKNSWECTQCYIRNDENKTKCESCQSLKDGSLPDSSGDNKIKGVDLSTGGLKFSFGVPASNTSQTTSSPANIFGAKEEPTNRAGGFGDTFKPKAGSWECRECYTRNESDYCLSCECPKDDTIPVKDHKNKGVDLDTGGMKFNFGMPATTTTSGFSFNTSTTTDSTKGFSFSLLNAPKSDNKEELVFGSPHKAGFEFTPRSPRRQSGGHAPDEESENSFYEEEEDNIYFKPVIPLPDKIEVTTGEEEEEILYTHRAKLFRHVDTEWKERGIGDLKILFKAQNKKLRVLMRREQIHKICLNHALTSAITYTPKDDKTWLFCANDFSEGELEYNKFCLRFKTAEIAQEFKKAVDDALRKISNENVDDDDEVEFVSETQVTPEEEEQAKRLGLPPKFMSYKQLPDCKCEQCRKDDEILEELFSGIKTSKGNEMSPHYKQDASLKNLLLKPSVLDKVKSESPENSKSSVTSLFGNVGNSTSMSSNNSIFGNASIFNKTTSSIFGGNSVFGTVTSSSSFGSSKSASPRLFDAATTTVSSNSENLSKTTSSSIFATGSIFGGGAVTTTPVFGAGATIFGGAVTTAMSLFGGSATITPSVFGNTATLETCGSPNTKPITSSSIFGGGITTSSGTTFEYNIPSNPIGAHHNFGEKASLTMASSGAPLFSTLANSSKTNSFSTTLISGDNDGGFKNVQVDKENLVKFEKSLKEENPFAHLGSGAPVFGANAAKTSVSAEQKSNPDGSVEESDEHYDPHYEPIVPLPDEIVVKTGEEEELPIFDERSKLYRFTDKEWKERGVGQLKILHHPKNNTFRLLLRREQVHKIVLNQRIEADFSIQPNSLSPNSYMWVGLNYCDDQLLPEKLATRFKYETIANKFYDAIQFAVKSVQATTSIPTTVESVGSSGDADSNIPKTIENIQGNECRDTESVSEEEEEYDDEEGEDAYDEDDRTILFSKDCTLSESSAEGVWNEVCNGLMEISYDPDIYGSRINFVDDTGCIISNTIIGTNTRFDRLPEEDTGNICEWKAVERADDLFVWKTLRVTFANPADAEDCFNVYLESLSYAEQSDIVDDIPADY